MAKPTLPASWYTSPTTARLERDKVFARNWSLFGPDHEVEHPGTWVARTVNGWPIVVLRDRGGDLRAFHNHCRHRSAALLPDGTGSCPARLVCPYHGWAYELDGTLAMAPRFGEALNAEAMALRPVLVASWRGCVFIAIDLKTPPLRTWLGSLARLAAPWPETSAFAYRGDFSLEGHANWKTYCDNTLEAYHLPFLHHRLAQSLDTQNVTIRSYDDDRLVVFHVTYREKGASLRGGEGIWFWRYPGFQGILGTTGFKAERIEPTGPGSLRSVSWAWYDPSMTKEDVDDNFTWARTIVEEDLAICESVQRNLEAVAGARGVLSAAMECHTAAFQDLVRRDVDARV